MLQPCCSIFRFRGSAAQFQTVAVGICDIERQAPARSALALRCRSGRNTVILQMLPDLFRVEIRNCEAKVVHVARRFREHRLGGEEVDERRADAQMRQPNLIAAPVKCAAQYVAVKGDRAVEVSHSDDNMIDSGNAHKHLFGGANAARQAPVGYVNGEVDFVALEARSPLTRLETSPYQRMC